MVLSSAMPSREDDASVCAQSTAEASSSAPSTSSSATPDSKDSSSETAQISEGGSAQISASGTAQISTGGTAQLSYSGLHLAPMVRIGTLPTRLLALHYGADLVYTEELVDLSLLNCRRRVNAVLGTVDFAEEGSEREPVLRVHPGLEGGRVILQIGTNDPERAVKVGLLVQGDVAGLDVNMGCPKPFSCHSGMGAALLKTPDKAEAILRALVENLRVPVGGSLPHQGRAAGAWGLGGAGRAHGLPESLQLQLGHERGAARALNGRTGYATIYQF